MASILCLSKFIQQVQKKKISTQYNFTATSSRLLLFTVQAYFLKIGVLIGDNEDDYEQFLRQGYVIRVITSANCQTE